MTTVATLPGMEGDWYRNSDGTVVHRPSCQSKGDGAVPWKYADGWDDERMAHAVATLFYLRACQHCSKAVATLARNMRHARVRRDPDE